MATLYEAQRRHARYYLARLQSIERLYSGKENDTASALLKFDGEVTQIKLGQSWAADNSKVDHEARVLCNSYPDANYLLLARQHPAEQLAWTKAALEAARQLTDPNSESGHLGTMATAYALMGDFDQAHACFDEALVIARKQNDRNNERIILTSVANVYRSQGKVKRALELYEEALQAAREMEDRLGQSVVMNGMGNAYTILREDNKAEHCFTESLALSRELGDKRSEGIALGNLGELYLRTKRYEQALSVRQRALVISRARGEKLNEVADLTGLGSVSLTLGRHQDAVRYFQQALDVARETGSRSFEAGVLGNLGTLRSAMGETEASSVLYEQVLRIQRELGDRQGEGTTLRNLGLQQAKLRQFPQALGFFAQARGIFAEIGIQALQPEDEAVFDALWNSRTGSYVEAIRSKSANVVPSFFGDDSPILNAAMEDPAAEACRLAALGHARLSSMQPEEALQYFHEASEIFRSLGQRRLQGTVLSTLAHVYAQLRRSKSAWQHFKEAATLFGEIQDALREGISLADLGSVYAGMGWYGNAFRSMEQARAVAGASNQAQMLAIVEGQIERNIAGLRLSPPTSLLTEALAAESRMSNNSGQAFLQAGKYDEACRCFQEVLDLADEFAPAETTAWALTQLGTVFHLKGDHDLGNVHYRAAIAIHQGLDDHQAVVRVQQLSDEASSRYP